MNFTKVFLILIFVVAIFSCKTKTVPSETQTKNATTYQEKLNVLFIVVDDLNDWIGSLKGHPDTCTPNIDRLAKEGTLFTNAHCAAPLCGPSRITMMTGKYPSSTGFYMNGQLNFRKQLGNIVTLPQYFKEYGYHTLGVGKLYPDSSEGLKLSFDKYKKIDTSKVANINVYKYNNGPKGRFKNWVLDGGPLDIKDSEMVDGHTTDWAIKLIEEAKFDKPFFLSVGLFRPHLDWFAPRKYFEKFKPKDIHLAETKESDLEDISLYGKMIAIGTDDDKSLERDQQKRKATAAYLANIYFVDTMIGKLLDALKKSKYDQNTIVVLTSDHGWHLGEKSHWRKFTLWQEATRVPLIVKLPNTNKTSEVNLPVSLIDLYPTLIDLCSLPLNKMNEGTSLSNIIQGKSKAKKPILVSYGKGNNAIIGKQFTYIQYRDKSEELYNNYNDPNQWENKILDKKYFDQVKELKKYLPTKSADNQPKTNGSTKIKLWHETFDYIKGKEIEFMDW